MDESRAAPKEVPQVPPPEVAFITGAGSGVGRAVATRLAGRGVALGLFDISAERLAATAAEIRAGGTRALELVGDVSRAHQVGSAVRTTAEQLGPLRTAIAAAGMEVYGVAPDVTLDEWKRLIDVNLTGVFLTAKYAIPQLEASGEGSFIAVGSDTGLEDAAGLAACSASKHGVVGLVRSLALDHGPKGVRCDAVFGRPQEVADAIARG